MIKSFPHIPLKVEKSYKFYKSYKRPESICQRRMISLLKALISMVYAFLLENRIKKQQLTCTRTGFLKLNTKIKLQK